MFDPPGVLRLTDLKLDGRGSLQFSSGETTGHFYRFSGQLNDGVLRGSMEYRRALTDRLVAGWTMTGAEIKPAIESGLGGVTPGHWSSYRHSREGGDDLGIEVEVFATTAGPVGFILFYQGGRWGEYAGAPFALQDIRESGDTITFQIDMRGQPRKYRLNLLPGTARAQLYNERQESYGELRKAPSLTEQLSAR